MHTQGQGGEACTGPLSADDVSWLSWGCDVPPTNLTTNKNYRASGNIFLGPAPISVAACGTNTSKNTVCCNNTMTKNAVGKPVDGVGVSANVLSNATAQLVGDNATKHVSSDNGAIWTFASELYLDIASDDAPLHAASPAGSPGTDTDFFGKPRAASLVEAGPFANISGGTARMQLWPPGGGRVPRPPMPKPSKNYSCPCAGTACCTGCGATNPCGQCGSGHGGHPTSCGLDRECKNTACDDNMCGCSPAGQRAGCCNFTTTQSYVHHH